MTIALGKVGKGGTADGSSVTASWTGGGNNMAGSTLLALLSSPQQTTITPTTPSGWTLRASSVAAPGTFYVYETVNASAISGLTINYSGGGSVPVALDIVEFQGAGSLDSSTSIATGTASTQAKTNGITTVAVNTVMVAFFMARTTTGTPRTLNSPGTGFTQCQSDNEQTDGTSSTTNYITYQVVTSVQTSQQTTCNLTSSGSWQCVLLAYAQAVPTFTPAARKRKRLLKRISRRPGKRRLVALGSALVNLLPFGRRRRRLKVLRALRRRRREFYGDITPIAPKGQCFTITVSEELGAALAVSEELAAEAIEAERLAASGTALERLYATGLVQGRLGCTVTIVCCR